MHVPQGDRRGLTLVELLIVVVLIGLLATIAIPKFANAKEKAYDAAALSDVRRAWVMLEEYFADNLTFPAKIEDAGFQPSAGVTFRTWKVKLKKGILSVHMDVEHVSSTHFFHSDYPAEAEIEKRDK